MKSCKLVVGIILIFGIYVGSAYAGGGKSIIEFSDTRIIIELNATDDDSGIQMFVDGEGWRKLAVFNPQSRNVLSIKGRGGVGQTGLTELFFESAEPGFDDLPLDEFLERFPEGEYHFVGRTVDNDWLVGTAELTHNLPAGPNILMPIEDSVVPTSGLTVDWDAVTTQFGGGLLDGDIVAYQILVVQEEPVLRVFSADVPASVTAISIAPEFLQPGVEYKVEVLAIEESGNQTLSEIAFSTTAN